MKRKKVLLSACVFLAGGAVGFLVGAGYSGYQMQKYMISSNAVWLSTYIEHLALIRSGDSSGAIALIEQHLDNSLLQVAEAATDRQGRFHPDRIPRGHLLSLQTACLYADAGYRQAFSDESLAILDQVPRLDTKGGACAPGLRWLQEQGLPGK